MIHARERENENLYDYPIMRGFPRRMASYNIEQVVGLTDWNNLKVALRQFRIDIQKAMD